MQGFSVTIAPSGLTFSANGEQSLMEAANLAGLFWPTVCGGEAKCLACLFPVAEGVALAAADAEEEATLARSGRKSAGHRLACKARATGDVQITLARVRQAREGDRLPFCEG